MKRSLMVLALLGGLVGGVATAAVQKGDTELDALGGFITENGDEGGDVDLWFVSASIGYFLTDNIRVGGEVAYANIDFGPDMDIWAIGGSVKYHFMPTNQWVPYVGAQVLYAKTDDGDSADGILWGPVAGLRYELNANNDFFVEYQYHLWSGDIGDVIDDGHAIFLGIVHQFK
jgi:predicted porin